MTDGVDVLGSTPYGLFSFAQAPLQGAIHIDGIPFIVFIPQCRQLPESEPRAGLQFADIGHQGRQLPQGGQHLLQFGLVQVLFALALHSLDGLGRPLDLYPVHKLHGVKDAQLVGPVQAAAHQGQDFASIDHGVFQDNFVQDLLDHSRGQLSYQGIRGEELQQLRSDRTIVFVGCGLDEGFLRSHVVVNQLEKLRGGLCGLLFGNELLQFFPGRLLGRPGSCGHRHGHLSPLPGQPLEGAWFRIRYLGGTSGTGGTVIGEYRTSSNGTIVVTGLKAGTYVCEEISAPDGYVITDAAETVYLSGKDQDVITVTFGNDKMGSLLIVKKDAVTGAPIPDVEFFITDSDGSVIGTANGKYVTDSAGTIRIDGLTPGMTVIAKEVRAKDGYILDDTPQSIKIKRNSVMTLEFRNQPKGGVLVKKVDAVTNAPISDVEFLVTDSDGNLIGNSNGKFVTDSAGTFIITDITPGTTLVIKETRAKTGYILDDTPQTVKVKSNEVVTVEFRNAPKGNLIIVKQDSVTKEPLEGVEFKITYADGSYVDAEGGTLSSTGLYRTDKEGKISISGISGTVVVTEVETIPGYTIDENTRTQTVVVNPNDTQTLYFYNTPVGGLQIIKSDKDSGERIGNVKFEIRKMNGEIIGTYTTDSDGVIYLPEAESGWYTVTELEAASGYLLDTTPHRIEVKDGQTATLEITNHKSSRILLHKVDKATGKGIYGAVFLLYDSNHNPIGEYVTDQEGYIYADEGLADGRYYLREIKAAPGYVLDPELKTIYVRYGSTTEIEWSNTAECGQIQIIKKSADDNATNGLPAGTLLEGAVFEIYDKAGNVVDTIKSDHNGRAVSKMLPLSRYTVREIKAPANYSINPTVMTAYLEFNGQIVTFEVQNTSVATGVSIKKTGPVQAVPGQPIRYVFSQIKNSSNVALDSFYWRDQLPAQVTLSKIVTGSYNQPLSYKVVYKTNLSGDYRTLADNLSTSKVYVLDARPAVLGLAANERVTEVMFVFGNVKAGFAQVETPYIYATARSGLVNNASVVNVADVGGLYNGQWIQAVSRWLTTVYTKTTVKLPKTGY